MVAGSISGSLSVVANTNTSYPVTYQWYENTINSTTGGTAINGETSASFNGSNCGKLLLLLHVLSSVGASAVKTNVATVTVS
ncbi:hypothetical protein KHA80_12260 [Anaerobacillus sp. HL2]|nr:hypothetical protein KHA80_12260 [Anaerobacillus sp. HL2]